MFRVVLPLTFLVTTLAAGCTDPEPTAPFPISSRPLDLAVIGDVPYGDIATKRYPDLIAAINRDPKVQRVVHIGDIKAGNTQCTNEWFAFIRSSFDTFEDPLVYTPGDNEWTDCHRPDNGGYDPLERLDRIRQLFFSEPGVTLGQRRMRVESQTDYPENQLWVESRVVFVVVHAVGSNNALGRITGTTGPTPAQSSEWEARDAANRAWIERGFALAEKIGAAGVAVFTQADMWAPGIVAGTAASTGHQRLVKTLAERAAKFARPVALVVGDTHVYRVGRPLVGDKTYGIPFSVPNLTQVTIEQSIRDEVIIWLRLHVDPRTPEVFSWEQVR